MLPKRGGGGDIRRIASPSFLSGRGRFRRGNPEIDFLKFKPVVI